MVGTSETTEREKPSADPGELAAFLDRTVTVGEWELASEFQGAVLRECRSFDPNSLPDGWCVGTIIRSTVYVRKERGHGGSG